MKACETCVAMTQENECMEQQLVGLRRRNKIYVALIRSLRDRVTELQNESDALVQSLYEADKEAETLVNDAAAGLVDV